VSATLWINTEHEITVELGGALQLYQAFSDMAKAAGDGYLKQWPDLFGVISQVETQEDAPEGWLIDMRTEAREFLDRYKESLQPHTKWVLEQLGR
jgi:predicted RNase H-like HicB family nuclease